MRQGINDNGELIRDVYVEHDPVLAMHADDGMTRQEFRDECDINVLMATYERTGIMNWFNPGSPQYLDVSDVPDLMQANAVMERASAAFMQLNAKIRREFDNDPVKFVEFAQDPANLSRMREWGLAPPAEPAGAISEPQGSPPSSAASTPS